MRRLRDIMHKFDIWWKFLKSKDLPAQEDYEGFALIGWNAALQAFFDAAQEVNLEKGRIWYSDLMILKDKLEK